MALTPEEVFSGRPYSYHEGGIDKVAVIQTFVPKNGGGKYVALDNGDKIELTHFCEIAEPVGGFGATTTHENNQGGGENQGGGAGGHYDTAGGGAGASTPEIKVDADGFPILDEALNIEQDQNKIDQGNGSGVDMLSQPLNGGGNGGAQAVVTSAPASDPIGALINKAKTEDTELSIDLIIPLIPQSLVEVISTSFEDDAKKRTLDILISKIDPKLVGDAIRNKLIEHYGLDMTLDEEEAKTEEKEGDGESEA